MSNILSAQLPSLKNRVLRQKKQTLICTMSSETLHKPIILILDKALRIHTLHTNGLGLNILYDIIGIKMGWH